MTGDLVVDVDGRLARPDVRDLLAAFRAHPTGGLGSVGVEAARTMVEASVSLQRRVGDVTTVEDVEVVGVPVRLYRPHEPRKAELLVYVHGGGWVTGSVAVADQPCRDLAQRTGRTVASVEYRRSPEARFPEPLDDVVTVVRGLADHRAAWGLDVHRLVLMGDSAGANLAASAVADLRDLVTDQVLLYPALDPTCSTPSHRTNADDPVLGSADMAWFWNQYLGVTADLSDPRVDARRADHVGAPRMFLLTCALDVLHDEGVELAGAARSAGVQVEHVDLAGQTHGFFWMSRRLGAADEAVAAVAAWLDRG